MRREKFAPQFHICVHMHMEKKILKYVDEGGASIAKVKPLPTRLSGRMRAASSHVSRSCRSSRSSLCMFATRSPALVHLEKRCKRQRREREREKKNKRRKGDVKAWERTCNIRKGGGEGNN